MSVVGSLIFCVACGNLLDSVTDVSKDLECSQCKSTYPSKEYANLKVVTRSAENAFPSTLKSKRSEVKTVLKNDEMGDGAIVSNHGDLHVVRVVMIGSNRRLKKNVQNVEMTRCSTRLCNYEVPMKVLLYSILVQSASTVSDRTTNDIHLTSIDNLLPADTIVLVSPLNRDQSQSVLS